MITLKPPNPQWLNLPLSRTLLAKSKDKHHRSTIQDMNVIEPSLTSQLRSEQLLASQIGAQVAKSARPGMPKYIVFPFVSH